MSTLDGDVLFVHKSGDLLRVPFFSEVSGDPLNSSFLNIPNSFILRLLRIIYISCRTLFSIGSKLLFFCR